MSMKPLPIGVSSYETGGTLSRKSTRFTFSRNGRSSPTPPDDSWMQDVPEDEQDWFRVCELIGLLTEYDDLSVIDTARRRSSFAAAGRLTPVCCL